MSRTRVLIPSLLILTTGCGGAAAAGPSPVGDAPAIKSTLDGTTRLPARVRWIATPSVPEADIEQVEFLIDNTLRATERGEPYNYGSDDFHGHLGWLVTSFLRPGRHKFTARAELKDGRLATDTVIATVGRAPDPPREIRGAWKRTVTDRDIAREAPGAVGDFPSGAWTLVFDRVGVWNLDPGTSGIAEHAVFSPGRLHIDAGLSITPVTSDGHTTTTRYGHRDLGAGFCREDGPPATYGWSVHGDQLTLRPSDDPCAVRRATYAGTWTRATRP